MSANLSAIAKRYSQALVECIGDDGVAGRIQQNVEDLLRCLSPEVEQCLAKETVTAEFKQSIIDDLVKAVAADQLLGRSLGLLADRKRLAVLRLFLVDVRTRLDARLGIRRVDYITAAEVTQDELRGIEKSLADALGGKVNLTVTVEPSLLAGCILRMGGLVADLSLKTRLMQLRESLSEGA